jgi:hypothetical protein
MSFSQDKEIRWDRVFTTPASLEKDMIGKDIALNHKEGIY